MSVYEEKTLSPWRTVLFLTAAFLLVYPLWKLGLRDLFWDEGEYAAIITGMHSFPPDVRVHGELISGYYPLYPLLVKGMTLLGFGMEFSLRFVSVFALAALTVLVGIIGGRVAGVRAGAASAAVMFTTLIAAEKAMEGYPNTLLVLLIFSGWMLWFFLGQLGGSWSLGWLSIGLFGGLTFYGGGVSALVYFLVPMMFLKRPFTPWRRFTRFGLPGGVLILLVFVFMWLIPRWPPGAAEGPLFREYSIWNYVVHSLDMTGDIAVRFLPWTFFLYAPFCAALIAIDENPLFSKYLRTLFTVLAVLVILNPFSKARDILYLVPVFSLMTGLNYAIVVRRHGRMLCRMLRWAAGAAFLCCAGVLCYEVLMVTSLNRLAFLKTILPDGGSELPLLSSLLEAAGGLLLAGAAYLGACRKERIWLLTVLVFTSGLLCFYAVTSPHRAAQRSRSEIGLAFRRSLGRSYRKDMTVYKDSSIAGLYPECYYLGTQIRTIPFGATGEVKDSEMYLISGSSIQPPDSSRTWSRIMDAVYKKQNLYMWKGTLNERDNGPENDIRNMRF